MIKIESWTSFDATLRLDLLSVAVAVAVTAVTVQAFSGAWLALLAAGCLSFLACCFSLATAALSFSFASTLSGARALWLIALDGAG